MRERTESSASWRQNDCAVRLVRSEMGSRVAISTTTASFFFGGNDVISRIARSQAQHSVHGGRLGLLASGFAADELKRRVRYRLETSRFAAFVACEPAALEGDSAALWPSRRVQPVAPSGAAEEN
jgi:hypothetical protein